MKPARILMVGKKIILKGGIYHITQRAPGRECLFLEKNDYLRFLFLLKKVKKDFNLSIFCFSLLPNHLHIFLRIKERNLDKAMKKLFQSYAQYFNKKYQRKGHVFCGVYRAAMCNSDDYLIAASVYIHLNAYKANLAKSPFSYKWHSLDVYIKSIQSTFVNREFILKIISSDLEKAGETYRKLVGDACGLEYKNVIEDSSAVKLFYGKVSKFLKGKLKNKSSLLNSLFDLEKEIEIFASKKRIDTVEDKNALRYLVEQLLSRGFTISDIAKKLNYNRCHIYRILKNN